MIATFINAAAILIGGLIGLLAGAFIRKNEGIQSMVFIGIGVTTLVIGTMMALRTERILYLALALVSGGVIGEFLGIERGIGKIGTSLHRLSLSFNQKKPLDPDNAAKGASFVAGFLEATVLFCVGSMAILGSIQAGLQGQYSILLTKSVMDGFMALLLAAGLGVGVLYSAVSIIVYQGAITLAAGLFGASVPELVLSEISGIGGAMILMISLNILGLKKIPTANFLPALVIVVIFALADPALPQVFK